MRKIFSMLCAAVLLSIAVYAGGYKVGDIATDFSLKNVNGETVSLKNMQDAKGFILVFTCNHCPYAVAYEDRIIALHNKFASQGYPVVAINPNDANIVPDDSYDKMKERAQNKKFPFVYLYDATQEIAKTYGATRTPHVFLVAKEGDKLVVKYIGAIDDNTEDAAAAKSKFVEAAIQALKEGKAPNPDFTKAVGCSIKWTKK